MNRWVRLWRDMPTDPKFRAIARKSGRPLSEVLALFAFMMTVADGDGRLDRWCSEDAGAAIDVDVVDVDAIIAAMQGKVISDGKMTGWEKRQPKREDDSRERVRAHRERKKQERNAHVTHGNAPESETETETEVTSTFATTEIVAARDDRANGPDEIAGLNGSTTEIVGGVARLLWPMAPDFEASKRIIVGNVGIYGALAVRDGYSEFMADIADNKLRVPSVKALIGYFKTASDRPAKDAVGTVRHVDFAGQRIERGREFMEAIRSGE